MIIADLELQDSKVIKVDVKRKQHAPDQTKNWYSNESSTAQENVCKSDK